MYVVGTLKSFEYVVLEFDTKNSLSLSSCCHWSSVDGFSCEHRKPISNVVDDGEGAGCTRTWIEN